MNWNPAYSWAPDDDATTTDSIFGHPAVTEVISCASINASDPGTDTIASYSSRGPSTIVHPAAQTRQTPFVTGIDGVSVTGAGGFSNPFYGTSASAPHIAAVCALMLDKEPGATPAEVRNAIIAGAIDRGTAGFDNTFGNGLGDALACVNSLDLTPPTVTINQAAGQADPASGAPINFTVVFSESVADFATGDVTITGTAPGTKTGTVTGSGTTYNVAVSGMTGSGTVTAAITSGKAHDAAGNGNTASTSTDNTVTYRSLDFGDLPSEYNLTTLSDNGARHDIPATGRTILGATIDAEADGQESADAGAVGTDGDDGDGSDDEDGISVVGTWQEGTAGGAVEVIVTGGSGYLSAWIDWAGNDQFTDAGDRVLDMVAVTTGAQTRTFDIPAGAISSAGTHTTFARFRLWTNSTPALTTTGLVHNGEVEDHRLVFEGKPPVAPGGLFRFR